ncbi:hypothetical protein ACNKHO_15585 [Shigella flexneri]
MAQSLAAHGGNPLAATSEARLAELRWIRFASVKGSASGLVPQLATRPDCDYLR